MASKNNLEINNRQTMREMRMDYVGERTLKADGWNRWMGEHDTTLKWMGACQYIHPKQFKSIFPKTRCSSSNFICFCLSVMQL